MTKKSNEPKIDPSYKKAVEQFKATVDHKGERMEDSLIVKAERAASIIGKAIDGAKTHSEISVSMAEQCTGINELVACVVAFTAVQTRRKQPDSEILFSHIFGEDS